MAMSRKCLMTYSEEQALIGCSESRYVTVPLPPGAQVNQVEMVPHRESGPTAWPYELVDADGGQAVRMHVVDCGQEAQYYRIQYQLPDPC